MAIGIARMFNILLPTNFNSPYKALNIIDFWRRWHISLSTWFRDYLYIPLGGSKLGPARTGINLLIVFVLCGFWHGASWTFLIWGLYHGLFLILERTSYGALLQKVWSPVRVLITFLIVLFGWVIFRCDTLPQAISFITIMLGGGQHIADFSLVSLYLDNKSRFEIFLAIVLAFPLYHYLVRLKQVMVQKSSGVAATALNIWIYTIQLIFFSTISYFTVISLAAGVYNPFIYFIF